MILFYEENTVHSSYSSHVNVGQRHRYFSLFFQVKIKISRSPIELNQKQQCFYFYNCISVCLIKILYFFLSKLTIYTSIQK
uniref:Uncharacterized protein n=1 Tax=Anguilla anguilla TaxID=7936 RepID=A0A0E9UW84_ANGAN